MASYSSESFSAFTTVKSIWRVSLAPPTAHKGRASHFEFISMIASSSTRPETEGFDVVKATLERLRKSPVG
jgi:hypothetical protein